MNLRARIVPVALLLLECSASDPPRPVRPGEPLPVVREDGKTWLSERAVVEGIPCEAGRRYPVTFHESGRLESATLCRPVTREQVTYRMGMEITLDEVGNVVATRPPRGLRRLRIRLVELRQQLR